MKKVSLKIKLTLLYTIFILVVVGTVLGILFSLSGREILASTKMSLERRVEESLEEIEMQDGELKIDSDFYSVENGVYLSMYDSTGYFLYGKIPGGFDRQPDFLDGEVREIKDKAGEEDWYIYDLFFRPGEGKEIYVRGVISVTESEESFQTILRIAFILLPLLAAATAFVGYRFTKRTLKPVKDITDTVCKIRMDADLSRRIDNIDTVRETKEKRYKKNRDEIYILAETFNEMLDELEAVFKREKQFTSDVSHELRTPISVMMAQCGQLLKDEALKPKQKAQVKLIEQKAENMSDLIAQLLFLSRADQGRQQIEKENVNLSELSDREKRIYEIVTQKVNNVSMEQYANARQSAFNIKFEVQKLNGIKEKISSLKEQKRELKRQIKENEEKMAKILSENDYPTEEIIRNIKELQVIIERQKRERAEIKKLKERCKEEKANAKKKVKEEKEELKNQVDDFFRD